MKPSGSRAVRNNPTRPLIKNNCPTLFRVACMTTNAAVNHSWRVSWMCRQMAVKLAVVDWTDCIQLRIPLGNIKLAYVTLIERTNKMQLCSRIYYSIVS